MRCLNLWLLSFAAWGSGSILRRSEVPDVASEHPELLQTSTVTLGDPPAPTLNVATAPLSTASQAKATKSGATPSSTLTAAPTETGNASLPLVSIVVSASASTETYFFGEIEEPTRTATSAAPTKTINWESLFKSYNCKPVRRPASGPDYNWKCNNFSGTRPKRVDWRNRWGVSWLTTVQNQGHCGSCWAFAATGVMETMARIQHGIWNKRSEGELKEASGTNCAGWKAKYALEWIQKDNKGQCDYTCDPYEPRVAPYATCTDRPGRSLKIDQVYELTNVEDQKRWLWQIGPLAGGIDAYADFGSWKPTMGVYQHTPKPNEQWDGHAMLIVGYDDDLGCWIVRNSWGRNFGDNGYIYIKYGQVAIDSARRPKYGVTNISPDPRARRRHTNGNIIQTGDGATHRDLEVLRRTSSGNIVRFIRKGEAPYQWTKQETIPVRKNQPLQGYGPKASVKGQPALIQSSYMRKRETMYWDSHYKSFGHWYRNGGWTALPALKGGNQGFGDIKGYPGFIETDDSRFMAVGKVGPGLAEFTISPSTGKYKLVRMITPNSIKQSGPSLVQSNINYDLYNSTATSSNSGGNLYVVAVTTDGALQLFWRTWTDASWRAGEKFAAGYNLGATPPVMIQDFWTADESAPGGFQLLIAHNGHIDHFQRVNDDIVQNPPVKGVQGKWRLVASFGNGMGVRHVWGLAQGSFNHRLEAVVEDGKGDLWLWEYDGKWRRAGKVPAA